MEHIFQVFEAERMVTRVGNFHRNCFSCIECNKKLDSTTVCEGEKINVQTICFPSGTARRKFCPFIYLYTINNTAPKLPSCAVIGLKSAKGHDFRNVVVHWNG